MSNRRNNMTSYNWTNTNIRQLINVVKANPIFYAKRSHDYNDDKKKTMAWEAVGQVLIPSCSGKHTNIIYNIIH